MLSLVTPCRVCEGYDPVVTPSHTPTHCEFRGIWDTGATGSVITANVVAACGLKPIGMTKVHGVGGVKDANVYLVNISVPNGVMFKVLQVTEGDLPKGTDVLIGMDIIATGDFSVTNYQGRTIFSFRHPSIGDIDFVKKQMSDDAWTAARRGSRPSGPTANPAHRKGRR